MSTESPHLSNVKTVSAQLFISTGLSVPAWARSKHYSVSSVYSAINGRRSGPKSRRILKQLEKATST